MHKRKCYFLIPLLFVQVNVLAQIIFKGNVRNQPGQPLRGVSISLQNNLISTTDSSGNFQFSAGVSKALLSFSYAGFETISGIYSFEQKINIMLRPVNVLLTEVVVKAYESNTALKNVPASVSVISRTAMERFDNLSLLPAINTVPGVKMDERSPGSYRLSIRGNLLRSPFGVRNVKVYWNGIPFTDANGNTYLNQLDFNNVGKIEIIKGPGGSMYGAGTGGVVLLTGRTAENNESRLILNTIAGSNGSMQNNIAYTHADAHYNGVLQYARLQSDGWRSHTNMRRDVAHYTGSFNAGKKQTVHANIFYSDLYYQTPGGLTQAQAAVNPRQSRPAAGPFAAAETQQAALYIKTLYAGFSQNYQWNTAWSSSTSVYTSHTQFKNPSILNYQRKTEQGIGARSVTQFSSGRWKLHAGGEYQYGFTSSRTFGNKAGMPDTLKTDDEIAATQFNIFLQAACSFSDDFILTAGASYNNYRYGFTRLNKLPAATATKSFDPVMVPRISLIKKITAALNIYATVSKGFSPPTIDEIVPSTGIFNPQLDAEKATNYELGLKGNFFADKLLVDAAYYLLHLNNTIVTRRDNSGADYFVNTGKTKQQGLEVSINYFAVKRNTGFLQQLKCWASGTFTNARFTTYGQGSNDYSGKRLTGTAPAVLVVGADAAASNGFYINTTYNYTDAIPLNDANSFTAKPAQLFYGKLGWKKHFGKRTEGEIFCSYFKSFTQGYSAGNDLNAGGNRYFNLSAPEHIAAGIKLIFIL